MHQNVQWQTSLPSERGKPNVYGRHLPRPRSRNKRRFAAVGQFRAVQFLLGVVYMQAVAERVTCQPDPIR